MGVDIPKLIGKINSGDYSRHQLETLRKNAIAKGGAPEVVSACEAMLETLPRPRKGRAGKAKDKIAEQRNGFVIMRSAYDNSGELIKPELVSVAKELSENSLAEYHQV